MSIAATLDAERASGTIRSALHGLPIVLKNNLATMDRMNTTAGSYSLLGAKVPRDSSVVARLRAAGLILLGKANMSQWANFRSSNSSDGWSSHGGQVIGAYCPNMSPGGSSSGSGVSTSIGLAFASLGTETSGSLLLPASINNVVAIKPTVGLTSRDLIIPISEHQDTIGPMAQTVSDAAHLLSIIAGKDINDNYTSSQPWPRPPDYVKALNLSSLRGARIGIPRNAWQPLPQEQPVVDAFDKAVKVMKKAGAIIIESTDYSAWDEYVADWEFPVGKRNTVLAGDFVTNIPRYMSQLTYNPNDIHNVADMINFTQMVPIEEYPDRDTYGWEVSVGLGFNNTDSRHWEAYKSTSYWGGEGGVTGAITAFNLSALILPTDYAFPFPAFAGLPVVTVPLGFYPKNTLIKQSDRNFVDYGPNIP